MYTMNVYMYVKKMYVLIKLCDTNKYIYYSILPHKLLIKLFINQLNKWNKQNVQYIPNTVDIHYIFYCCIFF